MRGLNDDGLKLAQKAARAFFAVLFLYITAFGGCTLVRQRGGPWVVTEDKMPDGTPVVRLEHHKLLMGGAVTLTFPGEHAPVRFTNAPYMRIFRDPNTNDLPYGPVEFADVTFLPGTIAFDAFGHLVELVPRTLYLDGHEVPWTVGTNLMVRPEDKLPVERRPKRR